MVALCCGPRAMYLAFVIYQASPVGGCESAIGMVADQPGRGKMCLVFFFLSSFFLSSFFSSSSLMMLIDISTMPRQADLSLGKLSPVLFNATPQPNPSGSSHSSNTSDHLLIGLPSKTSSCFGRQESGILEMWPKKRRRREGSREESRC